MAKPKSGATDSQLTDILARLDIAEEYKSMGVSLTGDIRSSGFAECRSMAKGEKDAKPSGWINIKTGQYGDSTLGGAEKMSFWDFAVKYGGQADFKTALRFYAAKVGVDLGGRKSKVKPEDVLEFEDWTAGNIRLATRWARLKHGVSVEAVLAFGGRVAYYPCRMKGGVKQRGKFKCVVLPVYPADYLTAAEPCGWIAWNITGGTLLKYRKGHKPEPVKMKAIDGSTGGLIGKHAFDRMALGAGEERILKTEGPTDALAYFTITPEELRDKYLVCCNANGATEDPERFAVAFAGRRLAVLHDNDQPGVIGVEKWRQFVSPVCEEFISAKLPGDVQEKHGPDLRDFICGREAFATGGPKSFDDVMALIDAGEVVKQEPSDAAPAAEPVILPFTSGSAQPASLPTDGVGLAEAVLRTVQIEVCGEYENGAITVFAFHPTRRKYFELRDIDRLTYAKLIQIAGVPVIDHVDDGEDDPAMGKISISQIKRSIAMLAGAQPLHDRSFHEAGCWQVLDERGHMQPEILLIGSREALLLDQTGKVAEYFHPRRGGLHLRFGGDSWYDHELLRGYLENYSTAWANDVIEEASALFSGWRWDGEHRPMVVTGLVLATWVQTIWAWRPQIAISGKTNSGKSMFFETLSGLFGDLADRSSKSSAAGIRQALQTSARICLLDEFEKHKSRPEILEMIRLSSRGDSIQMGTSDQRGKRFFLRHSIWVAATEVGLKKSPDRNRFIALDLLLPEASKAGQLVLQPAEALRVLGQKLLAIAIRNVLPARGLAIRLKATRHAGIADRIIESYSVPAAILATALGLSDELAEGLLSKMLEGVDQALIQSSDEDDLMQAILAAVVRLPRGEDRTVAYLLRDGDPTSLEALEKVGIAITLNRTGPRSVVATDHSRLGNDEYLFIDHRDVATKLLRATEWEGQSIDTHLRRINDRIVRRTVGSRKIYGVPIPMSLVRERYMGIGTPDDVIDANR